MKLEDITPAELEKFDFVVCALKGDPTPFIDNEEGTCSWCGQAVIYRPRAPKAPPRVCRVCFFDWAKGGHQ